MRRFITARWQDVLHGFWFIPDITALCFVGFALGVLQIDRMADATILSGVYKGDASAARTILSTIATSLITVAGVVFSLTVITLQLVSNQFTPRALRTLLADRLTQVTAGAFVGVVAYCLLVLRAVSGGADPFVPGLSVTVGLVLGVLTLALLLVFIHGVSQDIQVPNITARILAEALRVVDARYPSEYALPADEAIEEVIGRWQAKGQSLEVTPPRAGYVQSIDPDELVRGLGRGDLLVVLHVRPGDFVSLGTVLATIWPAKPKDDLRLKNAVHRGVYVASQRDMEQDVGYGIRQLADIALRAISPGMNDPTTAVTAIRYMGACLERLAERDEPRVLREYRREGVWMVVPARTFEELAGEAFLEIGRYAMADARVVSAVLQALAGARAAAYRVDAPERLAVLTAIANAVAGPALEQARTDGDRQLIQAELAALQRLPSR